MNRQPPQQQPPQQQQQQQQQRRPPYLFYSPKCQHSNQLIQVIQKNQQLAKLIVPVNIHQNVKNLPPQLQGVPAILVNGQILYGTDTFKWVQMQVPPDSRPENKNDGPAASKQADENELETLDICGNGKCDIGYTMLEEEGDKSAVKNKSAVKKNNFSFLDGSGTDSGVDVAASMEQSAKRGDGIAKQLEKIQEMRGKEDNAWKSNNPITGERR